MKPRSLLFAVALTLSAFTLLRRRRKSPVHGSSAVITGGTHEPEFLLVQKLLCGCGQVTICSRRSADLESALAKLGGLIAVPCLLGHAR